MPLTIGFIGFGEAGSTIATGLRTAGIERIQAFDINTPHETLGPLIRQRADAAAVPLLDSSQALATSAEILFSAVTASSAREAASQTIAYLTSKHTYVDINSVSPETKQDMSRIVERSGATFVEAAVMAPVAPYGHKVPMLLGGKGAAAFAAMMAPFGMNLDVVSEDVGKAVAVKMCRSIVVKGMEALLFECVLGARKYDAEERVFASLKESYPGIDWNKMADYTANRVVVHGERRAREMEEVAETLRAAGVEPLMAEATAKRQDWAARLNLKSRFGPGGPATYREVLDVIEKVSISGTDSEFL